MKYLRRTAEETQKKRRILEELNVTLLEDKLCTYRQRWFQRVRRMEDNRLPEQLLNYHPKGRRSGTHVSFRNRLRIAADHLANRCGPQFEKHWYTAQALPYHVESLHNK
jgi:predicted adenine nucleotide alpha hydrolase (AANH) superfamily ATPase